MLKDRVAFGICGLLALGLPWWSGAPVATFEERWIPVVLDDRWGPGAAAFWAPWWVLGGGVAVLALAATSTGWREKRDGGPGIPWTAWGLLVLLLGIALLHPTERLVRDGAFPPATEILDDKNFLPGVIDRPRAILCTAYLTGLLTLFAGLARLRWSNKQRTTLLWAVFLNTLLLSVVGSVVHLSESPRVLGIWEPMNSSFFATFDYKNHWVALAVLALGAGVALIGHEMRRRHRKARQRMVMIAAGLILISVTLPMRGSRSGMLLLAVMVVAGIAGLIFAGRRGNRKAAWPRAAITAFLVVLLVSGAGILALSREVVEQRVLHTDLEIEEYVVSGVNHLGSGRLQVYGYALRMAADRPVFGWGAGSFQWLQPRYLERYPSPNPGSQNPAGTTQAFVSVHSDWLQVLVEFGLVGFALLFVVPLAVWRRVRKRGTWHPVTAGCWFGCGLTALLACFEFPFGSPAVGVTFVVLAAIGYRAAFSEGSKGEKAEDGSLSLLHVDRAEGLDSAFSFEPAVS